MALGGMIATLSNARYIMVAFIIVSIQVVIARGVSVGNVFRYAFGSITFLVVLTLALPFLGYDLQGWFEDRLFSEETITETTRFKAIGNFITFFPEAPLLGTGKLTDEIREASNAVGSSHIHVGYLSHLVYYGLVGCSLLFGAWFFLWRKILVSARRTKYYGAFFAFVCFWWSFATMSQSSMFFGGLVIALVFDRYYLEKHGDKN